MAEDRPEEPGSSPDPARPKRPAPTIDLQATEVSSAPAAPMEETVVPEPDPEPAPEPVAETEAPPVAAPEEPPSRPISPWVIAPVSGAVAAALVIGVGWLLGWPQVQPAIVQAPQNAAAIDELSVRVTGLETKAAKPSAPAVDSAMAARIETLEKSITTLRGDLAGMRTQVEKLAVAPRDGAPAPDLSGITGRIDKMESAVRAQGAEITQQNNRLADVKAVEAKPADDTALRRVVAASLLDVSVRHSEAYATQLAAAKSVADNADVLKPLDAFATTGTPTVNALCRELLEIVPKLAPRAPDAPTTGTGIVDRLQAGAAKLVRIERTDTTGTDPGSVVARITAAALRNDLGEAHRQLAALSPADRAAAQAWLEKAASRDAALAASRSFADNAMAGLAKAGQ